MRSDEITSKKVLRHGNFPVHIFADLQAIMGPLPAFSSALLPGAFRRSNVGLMLDDLKHCRT